LTRFWQGAPLTATWSLGLIRDDGVLVARYPTQSLAADLYMVPRQGALMDYLTSNNYPKKGVVSGYSTTTDSNMQYAFRRLDNFPLTLFIAAPENEFLTIWWNEVSTAYVLFGLLILLSIFTYYYILRKQRTKELAVLESEAFAKDIINTVTSQVAVINAEGTILLVNEAWRLFAKNNGFKDIYYGVGSNYLDVCRKAIESGDTEAQKALDGLLAIMNSSAIDFSMEYMCDSLDRRRCFIMRAAQLSDGHRFVITHYNITERREAEEQRLLLEKRIQKAQKSESLARMASSVAHTFNNMLGAVLGNLELVLMDIEPDASFRIHIEEAMKASRKAATISKFMLTYLGKAGGMLEPTDMSSIINEACAFFHSALPKNISLSCMRPSAKYIVNTDSAQLLQILNNLINNAIEAIGDQEGSIDIEFSTVQGELIEVSDSFSLDWLPNYSDYVCITVSDTGGGIAHDNLGKIFDPFFSTKFTGRGLGLSVVCGLLKTLEGAIAVESEIGEGTVFKIYIPICEQYSVSESDETEDKPISGGTTLVLVVDDEETMRGMATAMLKRVLGYEVITAEDGRCAVEIIKNRKDEIGFIILDLTMPGMDGWETLEAIRAIRSDIPVILSSGYNEAQVKEGRRADEMPQAFLSKPYRTDDLKEAIKIARKH
jgi:signal transduction histidine kinase/ActR/RegA family two-component response regulator